MLPPPFPSVFSQEYGGTGDFYNKPLSTPGTLSNTIQQQANIKNAKVPAYKASQKQPGYVKSNFNFSVKPGDPKYYQQIYDWGQSAKDKTGSFASPWYDPASGMGYGNFNPTPNKKNPNPQPQLDYSYNAPKPWTPPPPTGGTTNTLPGGGSGLPPVTSTNPAPQFNAPSPYPMDANADNYDPTQFSQPGPSPTVGRKRAGIGGVSPSSGFAF